VHREKGNINPNKESSEMNFSKQHVISNTNQLAEPIVNTCKNREDGTHRENVVEMRNNVVSQQLKTHLATRIGLDLPSTQIKSGKGSTYSLYRTYFFAQRRKFGFHGIG